MQAQNRRNIVAVFITVLVVSEMVAYVVTTPRPEERFFQLYVLGSNRLAADYYPNDDPNIRLGDPVRWYLGVTDFMGSVQFVVIRVKLGNQTSNPPDEQQASPSSAPMITELKRFIQNNETWEFPFVWQIVDAREIEGSVYILGFQINNQTYTLQNSSARDGHNFRVIIELWTWDVDNAALQFGWQTGAERRVAWLQLWFNVTSTPPLV